MAATVSPETRHTLKKLISELHNPLHEQIDDAFWNSKKSARYARHLDVIQELSEIALICRQGGPNSMADQDPRHSGNPAGKNNFSTATH